MSHATRLSPKCCILTTHRCRDVPIAGKVAFPPGGGPRSHLAAPEQCNGYDNLVIVSVVGGRNRVQMAGRLHPEYAFPSGMCGIFGDQAYFYRYVNRTYKFTRWYW